MVSIKIIITGTPGTGKTSVAKRLSQLTGLKVIHLNEEVINKKLYKDYDEERESYVVDMDKLQEFCKSVEEGIIEGHLAHYCEGDIVIVLRANPIKLKQRMKKKGFNIKKIEENIEAEIIDVILQEVFDLYEDSDVEIYEIDTSDKTIDRVAIIIKKIIEDESYAKSYLPGKVDFTNFLLEKGY